MPMECLRQVTRCLSQCESCIEETMMFFNLWESLRCLGNTTWLTSAGITRSERAEIQLLRTGYLSPSKAHMEFGISARWSNRLKKSTFNSSSLQWSGACTTAQTQDLALLTNPFQGRTCAILGWTNFNIRRFSEFSVQSIFLQHGAWVWYSLL